MSSNVRKELRNLCRAIEDYHENAIEYVGKTIMDVLGQHLNAAYAALAEPLRNCEVGTVEEQVERWKEFCNKFKECDICPHMREGEILSARCFARWSQMPYKKEEAK